MHVSTSTHTSTHLHTHVHTHTHIYTYKHVSTHTYTHRYTYKHVSTSTNTHTHTHTQRHIHIHTQVHTHTYTGTYTYIHIHTQAHTQEYTHLSVFFIHACTHEHEGTHNAYTCRLETSEEYIQKEYRTRGRSGSSILNPWPDPPELESLQVRNIETRYMGLLGVRLSIHLLLQWNTSHTEIVGGRINRSGRGGRGGEQVAVAEQDGYC